jgi:hypothetical protein
MEKKRRAQAEKQLRMVRSFDNVWAVFGVLCGPQRLPQQFFS